MQKNLSDTSIVIDTSIMIIASHVDLRKAAEKILGIKKM